MSTGLPGVGKRSGCAICGSAAPRPQQSWAHGEGVVGSYRHPSGPQSLAWNADLDRLTFGYQLRADFQHPIADSNLPRKCWRNDVPGY